MIQSLERGTAALVFLSKRVAAGVTEVAEELGVNKSTAFRILETLETANMVSQDKDTAKYRLGPGILRLSDRFVRNLDILPVARPHMARLVEATGESAHLCMFSSDAAVVIEQVMTDSRLAVHAKIGNAEPAHCSSVGKCLLAFRPAQQREDILSRLRFEAFTEKTITDAQTLRRELDAVALRGYALDDGEMNKDVICIAAPIFNNLGAVPYSLGISGPRSRISGEKRIERLARDVTNAAKKLSEHLGYFRD
ncbi:MAG TPA: IclR family transcriptional regulator [Clostridia bacterium]|nr:IclR family transcriptional regulator [Clostridia bacterium]